MCEHLLDIVFVNYLLSLLCNQLGNDDREVIGTEDICTGDIDTKDDTGGDTEDIGTGGTGGTGGIDTGGDTLGTGDIDTGGTVDIDT